MPTALARPPRTVRPPRRKEVHIGPADHGRRMSLNEFDKAIGAEGYSYELNKGVIEVSDVPHIRYGRQLQELRDQLTVYRVSNPGLIDHMGGGSDAKLLVEPAESERHPDLSVYLDPR